MQDINDLTLDQIDKEIKYRNRIIENYDNDIDGIINTAKSEIEYLEMIKNVKII
jgi:hypothetical protein